MLEIYSGRFIFDTTTSCNKAQLFYFNIALIFELEKIFSRFLFFHTTKYLIGFSTCFTIFSFNLKINNTHIIGKIIAFFNFFQLNFFILYFRCFSVFFSKLLFFHSIFLNSFIVLKNEENLLFKIFPSFLFLFSCQRLENGFSFVML